MSDKRSPFGVFDSGIGGLTVARELMRQLPGEKLIYLGDTARTHETETEGRGHEPAPISRETASAMRAPSAATSSCV